MKMVGKYFQVRIYQYSFEIEFRQVYNYVLFNCDERGSKLK
jgi:hypothetical protein